MVKVLVKMSLTLLDIDEVHNMYHDNPLVNELVLTIINDGNGSICGYSYTKRVQIAKIQLTNKKENDLKHSYLIVANTGKWLVENECEVINNINNINIDLWDSIKIAARLVNDYYINHVKEIGDKQFH